MGNKPIRRTAALVSVATIALLTTSGLQAQQYPNPTTAAEVPGPSAGNTMTREYVQMVGRMAYFWGWPPMANANRAAAFSKAPEPGLAGVEVPIAYSGIAMRIDYITPQLHVIAWANQDSSRKEGT